MKIATWNVNSLKVRLPHVLDWLAATDVDILCLQETKTLDENFPVDELSAAGYQVVYSGQKTYNGVAIISKQQATDILTDIPGLDDPQRRILCATIDGIRVLDLYVVNGQEVGSEKYAHKLHWLEQIAEFINSQLHLHERFVVVGDFNIAPEDRDVYDPEAWHERILCSTPERQALQRIIDLGLVDTFRLFDQPDNSYSWWDYRAAAFRRNHGLRIDLILASQSLRGNCSACVIDKEPRSLERPSDHAPVVAEFNL
ncbi:MAG: exodeoxyribonuclease III [Gammaproteobacteria bacterium]|jgi:exodeoxyribonuclease-3